MKSFFSNLTQAQAMLLVGIITVILGGMLTGYIQLRQTQIPIEATQTAEAKQTLLAETTSVPTLITDTVTPQEVTDTPMPTPMNTATPTKTPRPTSTPTATIDADPTVYDNFNNPVFDGSLHPGLWKVWASPPSYIEQQDGVAVLTLSPGKENYTATLSPTRFENFKLGQGKFMEAKLLLSSETGIEGNGDIDLGLTSSISDEEDLTFACAIGNAPSIDIGCIIYVWDKVNSRNQEEYDTIFIKTDFDVWHTVRIEVDSEVNTAFYIDGQPVGSYKTKFAEKVKSNNFWIGLWVYSEMQDGTKGYIDDVRIGELGQ